MQKTENYELNLPETEDFFNLEHFNENTEQIDKLLKDAQNKMEKHTHKYAGSDSAGGDAINADKLDNRHANQFVYKNKYIIDLTDTTKYNEDTWFPVTGDVLPHNGRCFIKVNVIFGTSLPTWRAHSDGFSCNMELYVKGHNWGSCVGSEICTDYVSVYTKDNKNPLGYMQLSNSSTPVLFMRGGAKYTVYTDFDTTWTPRTETFTINNQSVIPLTECPSVKLLYRGIISANISGNAATAKKLETPRKINGVDFDGSADINVVDDTAYQIRRFAVKDTGWYRIMLNATSNTIMYNCLMKIEVATWGAIETIILAVTVCHYGFKVNVLSHYNGGGLHLSKIRHVYSSKQPYDNPMYIDILYNHTSGANVYVEVYDNVNTRKFKINPDLSATDYTLNILPEELEEGFTYTEIDISAKGSYFPTSKIDELTVGSISGVNYAGSSSAGGAATTALTCTGNAATATKATNDGNGNNIANTYVTKTNPKTTGYFLHDNTGSSADNSCAVIAGKNSQAKGNFSTAIGNNSKALADHSNAWGAHAQASGDWSYAIGAEANASSINAMAIGYKANASDSNAIVLGSESTASGNYSTAIGGNNNTASGTNSTVLGGNNNTASGTNSTVLGGSYSNAAGNDSIAAGLGITTQNYQFAIGYQNNTSNTTATIAHGSSSGTIFTIGNGTSDSKSNAFRVQGDGKVYAKGAYNATGADYAEFAEWADGNQNNEDRRGYFVTFDEEKPTMIRKANAGEYILGIVSGNPCIIGNGDEDWKGRYILDEFGAFIEEQVEEEIDVLDHETGEFVKKTITITKYKENPNYDSSKEYVTRAERQEWAAVGWIGVLSVRDDGTCKVGGYCTVADGGIATAAERGVDTYRVIERVTDNIVKVAVK